MTKLAKYYLALVFGAIFFLAGGSTANAQTRQVLEGYCQQGGQTVTTSGLTSTTKVQRSYPGCTVTVYVAGTVTLATIYEDSSGTPKANPFVANGTTGYWYFYGVQGNYDVQMSGAGISPTFTRGNLWIVTSGGGGGSVGPGTVNQIPRFGPSTTAIQDSIAKQIGTSAIQVDGNEIVTGVGAFGGASIDAETIVNAQKTYLAPVDTGPYYGVLGSVGLTNATTTSNIYGGWFTMQTSGAGSHSAKQAGLKATYDHAGSGNALEPYGVYATVSNSGSGNLLAPIGVRSELSLNSLTLARSTNFSGDSAMVGSTVSTHVVYSARPPTVTGGGTVSNVYGVKAEAAGAGITNYYPFYSDGGVVQFNKIGSTDRVQMGAGNILRFEDPGQLGYADFVLASTPIGNYTYKLPTDAPTLGDVLSVANVSGTDITLDWDAGGGGGGSNDVMRVQNVKEGYGCIGDGVTDDTTCIGNAITAANASTTKKIVYFPEGSYLITSGLTVPAGVTIRGSGPNSVITTAATIDTVTVSGNLVTFENLKINGGRRGIVASTGISGLIVRNVTFTGITAHTGGISTAAIYLAGQASDAKIVDSIFTGNGNLSATDDGADIMIAASATPFNNRITIGRNKISGGASRFSVACFDCSYSEIKDNIIDQNNQIAASTPSDISGYGIVVYATVNTGVIKHNTISGNNIRNAAGSGIYAVNMFSSNIENNTLYDTAKQQLDSTLPVGGISCNACDFTTITGNSVERSGQNGIAIAGNYGSVATLNGGINGAVTTITLDSTLLLGAVGDKITILVDSEKIACSINSATVINTCTRGVLGTAAAAHSNGTTVTPAGPSGIVIADNAVRAALGAGGITFRNRCEQCVVRGGSVSDSARGIYQTAGTPLNGTEISGVKITRPTSNGIYLDSLTDGLISDNVVEQATAQGIILLAGSRTNILNNTISYGAAAALDNRGTDGIVTGNTFQGNLIGVDDSGVRNIYHSNKLLSNTTQESFGATPTSQQLTVTSGATPSVGGADQFVFTYAAPTTVTNFTDGLITNPIKHIYFANANVTLQHSGSLLLDSDKDFNPKTGDAITIMRTVAGGWVEVGRSTSTNIIVRDQFVSGTQTYGATFEAVRAQGSLQAIMQNTTTTAFSNYTLIDDAGTKSAYFQLLNSAYPSNVLSGASTGTSLNIYTFGALDMNIGTNGVLREKWSSSGVWSVILGSDATGDMFYKANSNEVARLGIGTAGQCLVVSAGLPAWGSCAGGGGITGSITANQVAFGTGVNTIGGDADITWTNASNALDVNGKVTIDQVSTLDVPLTVTAVALSTVEQARFQNSAGQDKFGVTADANPYWRGQTAGVTLAGASDAKVYFDKNAGAIDGELVASKGGGSFRPIVVASESSFTGNVIPLWDNSNSWEIKNSILTQTSTTTVTAAGKLVAAATATLAGINVGGTTADPSAPVEGDIYYNSSTDKFRCYENSAWTNCIGSGSSLPVVDTTSIVEGSADPTKEIRFEVDGLTTATIRVLTPPDADIVIAGSASALTSGRVPYVTTGGLLLDTTNFQWNNGATTLTVGASGGSTGFIDLQGASNSGAIRMQGATHPGTGGGVILPFVGGSQSSGPGVWWGGGSYGSLAGFWISGGFNLQGWNSSNSSLKIRKGTGTSSDGTVIITFNPDSGYIELVPYGTSGGNTSEVRYMELAAGGSNYFATKAADAITTTYTMTWPTDTPAAGEFLKVTALTGSTISTEWAAGGGGGSPAGVDGDYQVNLSSAFAAGILNQSTTGRLTATPTAQSSGVAAYLRIITPADAGMTAATASTGIQFGGNTSAATVTRQWASGAFSANQFEYYFVRPTYAFTGATTMSGFTATVGISGPPATGTNATINTPAALYIESGDVYIGGGLYPAVDNTQKLGSLSSPFKRWASGYVIDLTADSLTLNGGYIQTLSNMQIPAAGIFLFGSTSTQFLSPSDGVMTFRNNAQTSFNRITWGPNTSSHPAIKRDSGTELRARLGDDSADAVFVSNGAPLYEGKLSSTSSVDLNVTTKTTLLTVPAGKTLYVTKVIVRNASTSLTTASYAFGFNANADDVIANATHTELTGSTLYTILFAKAGAIRGAAADVFGIKCSIAQGGAATVTVDVYGYYL